jgi:hypothetical protein
MQPWVLLATSRVAGGRSSCPNPQVSLVTLGWEQGSQLVLLTASTRLLGEAASR